MPADRALIADVRRGLTDAGDPARAAAMQTYMKSAMPFYGVAAPTARHVFRAAFDAHRLEDQGTWQHTVTALWDEAGRREERYAAIALAKHPRYGEYRNGDLLPLYAHLVRTGAWWDLVDDVAAHLVGPALLTHHAATAPVVRDWATDPDRWLRRTAVICQLGARERTDLDLLTTAVDANIDDRDFFLRKAIGWALRQYAYSDPDWVRTFVAGRADRLSGLSRREALKHLAAV